MKKLLLLIIDAFNTRTFLPALRNGDLPHFQALAEAGAIQPNCTAVFPSLTPAATASIITGRYPAEHGIVAYHWYDLENNHIIYYGDDFWIIWREGFGQFFQDFLVNLNQYHLTSDTLFQCIERAGLKTGSFNYLIFRGKHEHRVNVPRLLRLLPGVPASETVYGPSIMYFGDFVDTPLRRDELLPEKVGGLFHRFGFDDDNTMSLLFQFAEKQKLPDFSVAYLPDHDFKSHEVGAKNAAAVLEALDQQLGQLISMYGGLEPFLSQVCVLLTGDHAQTDILPDEAEAGIKLDELLADFTQAQAGRSWQEGDQLMLCPDMRSAQIYVREINPKQVEHVGAMLITDPRVDQVIWRAEFTDEGDGSYIVSTLDRGRLRFWAGDSGPETARDVYGNPWSWEGDLSTVSGHRSEDGRITFSDYPNAFERIVGGLNCKNSGHIWVTARPGYEFRLNETKIHAGGGSHGSLHKHDSTSPLLAAGLPEGITLPKHPRTVDIAPFCARILGI